MKMPEKPRAAISAGDVNGIGIEVMLKTFSDARLFDFCTPVWHGPAGAVEYYLKALNISPFRYRSITVPQEAEPGLLNVLNVGGGELKIVPGKEVKQAGKLALFSLNSALQSVKKRFSEVLITAPLSKRTVLMNGIAFSGHTSYLAEIFSVTSPLMLMVSGKLRIAAATGHIPLGRVAKELSPDNLLRKIRTLHLSLQKDFNIPRPKIALTGLNPHAGEEGAFGNEEREIILPAIEKAKSENIAASGPFSADGLFGFGAHKDYHAVLAMYHDQAMIPSKTLSSGGGVNFTAGLPIVRTSPAHGTAYDIAGRNIASEKHFREALLLACRIWHARMKNVSIGEKPLN